MPTRTFELPAPVAKRLAHARPVIEQGWEAEQKWWAEQWRLAGLPDPSTISVDEFRRLVKERNVRDGMV
jgi:hypothetical protein